MQASGLADSAEENALAHRDVTEAMVADGVYDDEAHRGNLHLASPNETERFIDLVEGAYLGEEYGRLAHSSDDLDYALNNLLYDEEWQELENQLPQEQKDVLLENAPRKNKLSKAVFDFLRRHLR